MPGLPTTPPRPAWQPPEDRLRLSLEIGGVLLLAIVPPLVTSLLSFAESGDDEVNERRAIVGVLNHMAAMVQVIGPLLFIMWRSGRPWAWFGIVRPHLSLDLLLSLLYIPVSIASYYAFAIGIAIAASIVPGIFAAINLVEASRLSGYLARGDEHTPVGLMIVWMIVNGFAEELVTKSYLIPRLRELFGSTAMAILLAAALFACYHIYYGSYAMMAIFFSQAVLGWLFVKIGRIWPLVLGHALYDLLLIWMPL